MGWFYTYFEIYMLYAPNEPITKKLKKTQEAVDILTKKSLGQGLHIPWLSTEEDAKFAQF